MKKIFFSLATLLLLLPNLAHAEEGVQPCSPSLCPCPKAFQGFYLGANVGYGIGSVQQKSNVPLY